MKSILFAAIFTMTSLGHAQVEVAPIWKSENLAAQLQFNSQVSRTAREYAFQADLDDQARAALIEFLSKEHALARPMPKMNVKAVMGGLEISFPDNRSTLEIKKDSGEIYLNKNRLNISKKSDLSYIVKEIEKYSGAKTSFFNIIFVQEASAMSTLAFGIACAVVIWAVNTMYFSAKTDNRRPVSEAITYYTINRPTVFKCVNNKVVEQTGDAISTGFMKRSEDGANRELRSKNLGLVKFSPEDFQKGYEQERTRLPPPQKFRMKYDGHRISEVQIDLPTCTLTIEKNELKSVAPRSEACVAYIEQAQEFKQSLPEIEAFLLVRLGLDLKLANQCCSSDCAKQVNSYIEKFKAGTPKSIEHEPQEKPASKVTI